MSAAFTHSHILAFVAILSLGAALTGCTRYSGDEGAQRSQQQSEQLWDRINRTQIDR